jgi:hypothetical protein
VNVPAVLSSASFWYVVLAVSGVLFVSSGVAMEFGYGFGLFVLGALALLGSEVIRHGMRPRG